MTTKVIVTGSRKNMGTKGLEEGTSTLGKVA